MSLIVGAVLAFWFLDPPWQYLVLIPLALWEALEVYLILKWRGVPSVTGPEAMVGRRGEAVTVCRPDGQVRVRGEIWRARCRDGVDAGDEVEVAAVEGLLLHVTSIRSPRSDPGSAGALDTQTPTA